MSRRLPPLNAMRAFEVAARHLSFTAAARELCVTQAAVSRHVALLEDWLGTRLFHRRARGIALTPAGDGYFRTIENALDQIDQATRCLSHDKRHVLRLKLSPTFASRWFLPRLARFRAQHPGIEVEVVSSHLPPAFGREDVDACVRWEAQPSAASHCRPLFNDVLQLVCSPRLLAHRPLARREALGDHVLLCSTRRPYDLQLWLSAQGLPELTPRSLLTFDNSALVYQAAVNELGVAIAQRSFVEEDIAAGRLVAPLGERVRGSGGFYLSFPPGQPRPERTLAFERWLIEETVIGAPVAAQAA